MKTEQEESGLYTFPSGLNPFSPPREWREKKARSLLEKEITASWRMTKIACGGLFALSTSLTVDFLTGFIPRCSATKIN